MSLKRNGGISSFGIAIGFVAAISAQVFVAEGARAETAPTNPPQQAQPAPPTVAPTEWVKVCDPQNPKLCQISEDYGLVGSDTPVGSISIQTTPDPNKFGIGIQVPIGFLLEAGIPLSIDGTKKLTAQFITCLPAPQSTAYFCLGQVLADNTFIDAMKKGKKLQLQLVNLQKSVDTMVFPLDTFADSFDGPDQAAIARQREDAAKVLAEKAKQRAKQLEGQPPPK
jgi:invasion protein IalB